MGPLELVVIGFEGDRFQQEILPEITSLGERGIVRVLELALVTQQGNLTSIEFSDVAEAAPAPAAPAPRHIR